MQITSRFTIAVHILCCIEIFEKDYIITSSFLAGSIGANPVIIRTVMGKLKDSGIIDISQGKSGISLARPLDKISFYDIYEALEPVGDEGLFHFHENPNIECPVGRNIHHAMDGKLKAIQSSMENEMRSVMVSDIVNDIKKQMEFEN